MSERFKKNTAIDGWPIEDTQEGVTYYEYDKLIGFLNDQDKRFKMLEAEKAQLQIDKNHLQKTVAAN